MPNTFLTPSIIARQALANLYETTVMAQLVHRDYEAEFVNRIGDTITIRKPAIFEAKSFNRTTGIEIQNATEGSIPITLDKFVDVSFAVTSEELTLDIIDFNAQLLAPAVEAIAQRIDRDILSLRADVLQRVGTAGTTVTGVGGPVTGTNEWAWDNPRVVIDARRVLNQRNVPPTDRFVVVGPEIEAQWLGDPLFHQADTRGDTEGLREANLGRRVFGHDGYQTQNIKGPSGTPTTGQPNTEIGVAFHKTAFALVTRPLVLPQGAANAHVESYKGFALRVVMGYDQAKKQDIVSIDTLYGVKTLDADRAVKIHGVVA
ncbi:P22 phage major capsid protein family protein [Nonomuraea wenchangensis]|uniref:P22 coat protein-gene protein 5 n=1 Tax=Nonomuraea wenchangensis TaxID=568860 RepID=A0A1I0LUV4_9ACTN|nr:P22 phage major capsid protein family protein [Nonomuraea wenchangensis]SEU46596.1 P22 coat protein-gene protein 5 [Nonomuraea wenchangensis]